MTVDDRPRIVTSQHMPGLVKVSEVILGVLALGALQGGVAMVIDPLQPLGMSTDFLEGTPVSTYFWPGIFLLAIAAASTLNAIGLHSGWRWRWAESIERTVGLRWPWIGLVATATVLLAFEVVELFVIPFHPIMHPLLIAISVTLLWLAMTPSVKGCLRVVDQGD